MDMQDLAKKRGKMQAEHPQGADKSWEEPGWQLDPQRTDGTSILHDRGNLRYRREEQRDSADSQD